MARYLRKGNDIYRRTSEGGVEYVSDPTQVDWGDVESVGELPKSFREQAESLYAPLKTASESKLSAARKEAEQTFTDLSTRIRESGVAQQEGLRQDLTRRGFIRSGEQIGTGEKIAKETTASLDRANIARTIAEANAILENANFQVDINSRVQSRIDELRTKEEEKQKLDTLDLGDRVAFIDQKGNIVKEIRKGKLSSGGGGGRAKTKGVMGQRIQKAEGFDFTDKNGNPITPAEYANQNNMTIAQVLEGSNNQGDIQFINDYTDALNAIAGGAISKTQAVARLKSAYPWMGDIRI